MYNTYFGFSEAPFENNLDLKFLFLNEDNKEVLASLFYFIEIKKALGIVCGDVGTGKTTLIKAFFAKLLPSVEPIIILNPFANPLELLKSIAKSLKIKTITEDILELTENVTNSLIKSKDKGIKFILIIDEAHLLSNQSLEEIRLLSNIEISDEKLLPILLFGQYELSHKLDLPEMRHIRQRININRFLTPLNLPETIDYIDYRLKQVGSSFESCFENNCKKLIFKITKGVPRHINQLCDNSLLICMTQEKERVNRKVLKMAEDAWQTDRIFTPESPNENNSSLSKSLKNPLVPVIGTAIILLLGGFLSFSGALGEKAQQFSRNLLQRKDTHLTSSQPPVTIPSKIPQEQQAKEPETLAKKQQEPSPTGELAKPIEKPESNSTVIQPPPGNIPATSPEVTALPAVKPGDVDPKLNKNSDTGTKEPSAPLPGVQPIGQKPSEISQTPVHVVVKKGESLSAIAAKNYPGNEKIGFLAIVLANPEITQDGLIYANQALQLPKINFKNGTIELRNNLFYAPYGLYYSPQDLKNHTDWLTKNNIKFVILRSVDGQRKTFYRVVFGGYEKEDELKEAFERINKK